MDAVFQKRMRSRHSTYEAGWAVFIPAILAIITLIRWVLTKQSSRSQTKRILSQSRRADGTEATFREQSLCILYLVAICVAFRYVKDVVLIVKRHWKKWGNSQEPQLLLTIRQLTTQIKTSKINFLSPWPTREWWEGCEIGKNTLSIQAHDDSRLRIKPNTT